MYFTLSGMTSFLIVLLYFLAAELSSAQSAIVSTVGANTFSITSFPSKLMLIKSVLSLL